MKSTPRFHRRRGTDGSQEFPVFMPENDEGGSPMAPSPADP
jgi:hypothetical protein